MGRPETTHNIQCKVIGTGVKSVAGEKQGRCDGDLIDGGGLREGGEVRMIYSGGDLAQAFSLLSLRDIPVATRSQQRSRLRRHTFMLRSREGLLRPAGRRTPQHLERNENDNSPTSRREPNNTFDAGERA